MSATERLERLRHALVGLIMLGVFALVLAVVTGFAIKGTARVILTACLASVGLINVTLGLHTRGVISRMIHRRRQAEQ